MHTWRHFRIVYLKLKAFECPDAAWPPAAEPADDAPPSV
jgi:hypothetical protein